MTNNNQKRISSLFLFAVLFLITACGKPFDIGDLISTPPSGSPVFISDQFNLTPGQSWDMQAANGDLTHFNILSLPSAGCEPGVEFLDLHTTKTAANDWWQVGWPGAEIHWIMRRDVRGNWNAVASLINTTDPSLNATIPHTIDYILDNSNAYLVIPDVAYSNPQIRAGEAGWLADMTEETTTCLRDKGIESPARLWTAKLSIQNVQTPVYSGPALLNEEFEGCAPNQLTSDSKACAHERWYFAPNIGLVEIDAIWENAILKRIN
jgi:hypothetical protein